MIITSLEKYILTTPPNASARSERMPRPKLYPAKKYILLDSELARKLLEASKRLQKTQNEIIREALRNYLRKILPEEGGEE
ncbi:ribbon-helix-helix protein, CopG family [Pyrobaculum sp.]|uniref:ribbon-helix-helix protein, CopG family n=1 Tax=Pyrobaculum sp. TaxID=2004705 RepID=UPI00316F88E3